MLSGGTRRHTYSAHAELELTYSGKLLYHVVKPLRKLRVKKCKVLKLAGQNTSGNLKNSSCCRQCLVLSDQTEHRKTSFSQRTTERSATAQGLLQMLKEQNNVRFSCFFIFFFLRSSSVSLNKERIILHGNERELLEATAPTVNTESTTFWRW